MNLNPKIRTASIRYIAQPHLVFKVKIQLDDAPYPIWRILLVSGSATLAQFQDQLIHFMGWTAGHLSQLEIGNSYYLNAFPGCELQENQKNANKYVLYRVLKENDKFKLLYDFGDCWYHTVKIEAILRKDKAFTPFCIRGKGKCPPDDCGGIYGFIDLLQSLEDPNHPSHEDNLEWLGGEFDPDDFSPTMYNPDLRPRWVYVGPPK